MASKDLPCATQATMTASLSCFIFEGAAYNIIFIGRILPAAGKEALVTPYAIIFNLIWGLALASYIRAHIADPGRVPKRWQEFVRSVGDALPVAPPRQEWQPGKATFCERCEIPRPERAHHCTACQTCVLRMDHHCAWIDNCVGFHNHKFFFLLLIYAFLASVIAVVTSLPEFLLCLTVVTGVTDGLGLEAARMLQYTRKTDVLAFVISGILSLFFAVLLLPMVYTHLPLAARNQTAIESNYQNMPNPFDQGSRVANVAQIFGACGPDWVVPVQPFKPLSDGITFRRSDESGSSASFAEQAAEWNDGEDSEVGGSESEKLWKMRYRVRRRDQTPRTPPSDAGPLSSFARWWKGNSAPELTSPSALGGSKRELVLG
mmetsp:Transcript_95368/g.278860  ORF Transcript_95368/g.278860 Transcript_95368/m.278860 type:complete len:375 (-) Transcript_95368:89-1213(-)